MIKPRIFLIILNDLQENTFEGLKIFPHNSNLVAFSPKKILFCLIIELESGSFFSFVALDKLWTECFIIKLRIFLIILIDLQENALE